jgi:hypothetical protein
MRVHCECARAAVSKLLSKLLSIMSLTTAATGIRAGAVRARSVTTFQSYRLFTAGLQKRDSPPEGLTVRSACNGCRLDVFRVHGKTRKREDERNDQAAPGDLGNRVLYLVRKNEKG